MSEQGTLSGEFIKQLCATYGMHEPLITAALQEHKELKVYLGVMRAAVEMSDEPNPEFIAMLTRIITHLENTSGMLKRLHAPAKQAYAVMKEHMSEESA